jgi:SAM-dependent methyltransferase
MRCPVCDCESEFRVFYRRELTLFRCTCGFVFQNPKTVLTDYGEWYGNRPLNGWLHPWREPILLDTARRIAALQTGLLLDVGAGDGHFVACCQRVGLECVGVEGDSRLADYAARRTGVHVQQGMYRREMFGAGSFDAVSLIQVLEHAPEPQTVLRTVREHLRPGGLVAIEVPSLNAPHFLAYRATGIPWFVKHPRGVLYSHCGYYSPRTVRRLVERCGFDVCDLVVGRWGVRTGVQARIGRVIDPALNRLGIGGILLLARKR